MLLYRICKEKYVAAPLDGEGARRAGGRWNSKGVPMVYTSEHPALALLEARVHIGDYMEKPLESYCLMVLDCPEISTSPPAELPLGWDARPAIPETSNFGDRFIVEGQYLAMRVPSVIVGHSFNILLNPRHPLRAQVQVVEVIKQGFDLRLFA